MIRGQNELGIRLHIRKITRNEDAMLVFNDVTTRIGRIREEQQIHIAEKVQQRKASNKQITRRSTENKSIKESYT